MRILVAEDERDLNRLIAKSLEEAGYSVDRCHDGGEAMDFIRSAEYDAVVLDVMMPVMSGHEVVRQMRAEGIAAPVLFLTALDSVDDRVRGLDLGADEAAECLARGAYLSFSGIVSFKSAADVQAAAAICPADRFLVETDSPYLAPVPHRGKKNQPAWVTDVGAALAAARGTDVEAVRVGSWENAARLYHL